MKTACKIGGVLLAVLLVIGIAAPYITADQFGKRLQKSLERSLGRRVELGKVHFSLFEGPGFSVDSVTIHEDPAIGAEPIVYINEDVGGGLTVRPSLWSLLGGKFVIASITLDTASINLTKSGPASEWGRWNFASLVSPAVMRKVPAIHVRHGRINFKFGDRKSVFYLQQTDLDISPPGSIGRAWSVDCSAQPSRTDRTAQGLGAFRLKGRWFVDPNRVDLDLQLERTGLGELTALMRGQAGSVHGTLSSHLHLGGPIQNIGIAGRLHIEDIHRWDLLPTARGEDWPLDIRGHLDLMAQQFELQTTSAGNVALPLTVRFRASDYLSQPRWAVSLNWNRFPAEPLLELGRHMGAPIPAKLQLGGTIDGAIGYSGEGSFQGELAFHDASLTIPDSPPVRFEQARIVVGRGHVYLAPSLVRTGDQDQAQVEADYSLDPGALDLSISTESMKVASLHSQAALAAVPWLEQVQSGVWQGQLHYHGDAQKSGWTGSLQVRDAEIAVPGLADPLQLASARALINGARVELDRVQAQAGKVAFTGQYSYEPAMARPHRLRLQAEAVDAADLEAEMLPTLQHSSGLLARALGRNGLPDWLQDRRADATLQIGDLLIGGAHLANLRTHLVWDSARVEMDGIQARMDGSALTGRVTASLRGSRPAYHAAIQVKGLGWQSGKLDAQGTLDTSGTGVQLLSNLTSQGFFVGAALDFGAPGPWRNVSGNYNLTWSPAAPRLHLTSLSLRNAEETYTGSGATQGDGKMVILLTNGTREVRVTGPLDNLKVDEGG
ncbi:MAG TPA: hypothetical protein VG456_20060 [Candidatus Sulfopaludibacter sp.]|jgi:hypothetical protein|nr:hypothetical protein [Candidatus Sulfopaludibacter sp.]